MDPIKELLTRGVDEVIDAARLEQKLKSGKKLRVKLGIDPTSPNIHIGRASLLWKLRKFQDLGHTAVFIIGDFTGVIGDTSDKDSERPMLSPEQIKLNMKTYFKQASKILDKDKVETYYNSKWLKKLGLKELAEIANLFGLHEFESREIIAKRMKAGKRVSFHEMLYPLMQGYDSVQVKADVELGGTDQRFNLLTGRRIQEFYKQEPQDIVMLQLLEGTDGRKMSSSWGNVINITDDSKDMFGKIMSVGDSLIIKYFTLATQVPLEEVAQYEQELKNGANPRHIKKRLAESLVTLYYGEKKAAAASKEFDKVFSQKEKPTDIPEVKHKGGNIIDVLVDAKLAGSKSEARRLIEQNGVKVNDQTAKVESEISSGDLIQVGKRRFVKIV